MFTGIVQEIGTVRETGRRGGYQRLSIAYDEGKGSLSGGDSIAVSGVCLTAESVKSGVFSADLSEATHRNSTLGDLKAGDRVNLERPVTASDPLGGHIVLGHVDGQGLVRRATQKGGGLAMSVKAPPVIMSLVVDKGSVAVDGVSLTVSSVGRDVFEVFIIPETQRRTTLGRKRVGEKVNLEADYLAKLVKKIISADKGEPKAVFPSARGED